MGLIFFFGKIIVFFIQLYKFTENEKKKKNSYSNKSDLTHIILNSINWSYLWVKHNLFFWNCIFATLTSHHYIFQNIENQKKSKITADPKLEMSM